MAEEQIDRGLNVGPMNRHGVQAIRDKKVPNIPVIVIHLEDPKYSGLTACSGDPLPGPVSPRYANVPRYLCQGCAP